MLLLDANILMRAVLGKQARALLAKYGERIEFVAPDVAFDEARRHLPRVIESRGLQEEPFLAYLDSFANVVRIVEFETCSSFEAIARQGAATRTIGRFWQPRSHLRWPIWAEDTRLLWVRAGDLDHGPRGVVFVGS